MNKNLVIFLFLPAFLFLSCNKWLEEKPKSGSTIEGFVTGEETIGLLCNAAYASLQDLYGFNNNPGVVGNDECMSQSSTLYAKSLDQYVFTPSTGIFERAWNAHFKTIQNANIAISRVWDSSEISDGTRLGLIGQMRFLRAFAYFRLVQWFGQLPLITDPTVEYNQAVRDMKRSSIGEVYDLIVSDLQFASSEGILPEVWGKESMGRPSRYAAKTLLAKVYLTMGTSKARTMARPEIVPDYLELEKTPEEYYRLSYDLLCDVVDNGGFSLLPVYGDLFLPAKKNSGKESIWEIQYSSAASNAGSSWSKYFGIRGEGKFYTYNAMVGRCIYLPVPNFWAFYKKGDVRLSWNLKDYRIKIAGKVPEGAVTKGQYRMNVDTSDPGTLNAIFSGAKFNEEFGCSKYRWGMGDDPEEYYLQNSMSFPWDNCPVNVIVMRYADVLLMLAEADILLNGTASARAVDLVNSILYRARAGKTETEMWNYATNQRGEYDRDKDGNPKEITPVPDDPSERARYMLDYTAQTLTLAELKKERARELCFEFHRWTDLVRWGDLETAIASRVYNTDNTPVPTIDPAKHYLFPVPQSEMDICRNFVQNPGYVASGEEWGGSEGE